MFTEKTKLVEKRENPFYGSYKEKNIAEEIHWQNKYVNFHRQTEFAPLSKSKLE